MAFSDDGDIAWPSEDSGGGSLSWDDEPDHVSLNGADGNHERLVGADSCLSWDGEDGEDSSWSLAPEGEGECPLGECLVGDRPWGDRPLGGKGFSNTSGDHPSDEDCPSGDRFSSDTSDEGWPMAQIDDGMFFFGQWIVSGQRKSK